VAEDVIGEELRSGNMRKKGRSVEDVDLRRGFFLTYKTRNVSVFVVFQRIEGRNMPRERKKPEEEKERGQEVAQGILIPAKGSYTHATNQGERSRKGTNQKGMDISQHDEVIATGRARLRTPIDTTATLIKKKGERLWLAGQIAGDAADEADQEKSLGRQLRLQGVVNVDKFLIEHARRTQSPQKGKISDQKRDRQLKKKKKNPCVVYL